MMLSMRTFAVLTFFIGVVNGGGGDGDSDDCRTIQFRPSTENKVLENHVIRSLELPDEDTCQSQCFLEPDCVSINYGPSGNGKQLCELNDRNHLQASSDDFVAKNGHAYRTVLNSCLSNPCSSTATCQTGFTSKGYRCICPLGYEGEHCGRDIDECSTGSHNCSASANCTNIDGSFECHPCILGYVGDVLTGIFVPDPIALYPLNSQYGTREINGRARDGVPFGVQLASGPCGTIDGSYEFSGNDTSYIEFPNNGELDAQHSMTMLCWVNPGGQDGPMFNYKPSGAFGVHLWIVGGRLFVRFNQRDYSSTYGLGNPVLTPEQWKFVGASYDNTTGDAKLWINGAVVQTHNIGVDLLLATQDDVRMGVRANDGRYFKGKIARMQVYNVALRQDQIQVLQGVV